MSKRQSRNRSRALALEPRVLFDGALVDAVAVDAMHVAGPDHSLLDVVPASEPVHEARGARDWLRASGNLVADFTRLSPAEAGNLRAAVTQVDGALKLLAASPRFEPTMREAFGITASGLEDIRTELASGKLGIELVVRDARDLRGAPGTYAAVSHLDIEAIYINADWLALVTPSALGDVLVKEIGRALDQRLHGRAGSDASAGAFARGVAASSADARNATRNAMHAALRNMTQGA